MSVSVCVCVFVCPRLYLRNCTSYLHQFFVHVSYGCGSVLLCGVMICYVLPVLFTYLLIIQG